MSENVIKTELECPHCGETIIIERPAPQRRGALAGLSLEEMTDEQLKIEIRNAKSVLYKAKKREASEETIARNQARVDAALIEKAKREEANAPKEDAEDTPADNEADEVYDEEF